MIPSRLLRTLSLLFFAPIVAFAQGGPPMVTDDPGTPGNGHWEINIASQLAATPNHDSYLFPYFDINYGLGDHVQLKAETGEVILRDESASARTGIDSLLVGVKIRFLDEETAGVSVSTYPQFQFHPGYASNDPDLAARGNLYFLPIELSKAFGNWEINPEAGYLHGSESPNELVYGVVFAFERAKPWEPLFEVHVNTNLNGSGSATLLNAGARFTLNPKMNLMAALGRTVTHVENETNELDAYLGLQLEL